MLVEAQANKSVTRRTWLLAPVGLAGLGWWWLTKQQPLPGAAEAGTGEPVSIVLFSDQGERHANITIPKLVRTPAEWRQALNGEAFAVTRGQATEFAFHNVYWDNHKPGVYRCVCCGNALFRSRDKYDSGTGWPSFTAAIAPENVWSRTDKSLGMDRIEILCRKCDAHLGHLFDDGPPPGHHRYCLNSAALRFVAV